MFQRRKKRPPFERIRGFLWPHMGWRRFATYVRLRIIRLNATPYQIACGLAFGASISFIPLPGTHILLAALLTFMVRGNVLASALGTIIGNPWTFPFMWWGAYKVGVKAFTFFDVPVAQMPATFEWHDLVSEAEHHPFELLVPWITGGFLLGLVLWPVFYYFYYRLVCTTRRKHAVHRRKRAV